MNELMPLPLYQRLNAMPTDTAPAILQLGPATLTVTDTALIVAIGPSRMTMTADGIRLDAPRIDLNRPDSPQ